MFLILKNYMITKSSTCSKFSILVKFSVNWEYLPALTLVVPNGDNLALDPLAVNTLTTNYIFLVFSIFFWLYKITLKCFSKRSIFWAPWCVCLSGPKRRGGNKKTNFRNKRHIKGLLKEYYGHPSFFEKGK